jgi:hypothetical protein
MCALGEERVLFTTRKTPDPAINFQSRRAEARGQDKMTGKVRKSKRSKRIDQPADNIEIRYERRSG